MDKIVPYTSSPLAEGNRFERSYNKGVEWIARRTSRHVRAMALIEGDAAIAKVMKVAAMLLGGFFAIPFACVFYDGVREICCCRKQEPEWTEDPPPPPFTSRTSIRCPPCSSERSNGRGVGRDLRDQRR